MVTYLKIKDIILSKDESEANLLKNSEGKVIVYNRSENTCKFILKDSEGNEGKKDLMCLCKGCHKKIPGVKND